MSGFDVEDATRSELERMARRLSDMAMFRDRIELHDSQLVGLLDDEELRALVRGTVAEFKDSFR